MTSIPTLTNIDVMPIGSISSIINPSTSESSSDQLEVLRGTLGKIQSLEGQLNDLKAAVAGMVSSDDWDAIQPTPDYEDTADNLEITGFLS